MPFKPDATPIENPPEQLPPSEELIKGIQPDVPQRFPEEQGHDTADVEVQPEDGEPEAEAEETQKATDEKATAESVEAEEQKREKAFEFLANPDLMREAPVDIARAFRDATGEDIDIKIEQRLNKITYVQKEPDVLEMEKERVRIENRGDAMTACWERVSKKISQKDGDKYMTNGLMDPEKFKTYLGRKRYGLMSEDAFNGLANNGYRVEDVKVRKMLTWMGFDAVTVSTEDGKGSLSFDSKEDFTKWAEDQASKVDGEAKRRADEVILKQGQRLAEERSPIMESIVKEAVSGHNLEKQNKQIVGLKAQGEQLIKEKSEADAKSKTPEKPGKPERKKVAKKPVKKSNNRGRR